MGYPRMFNSQAFPPTQPPVLVSARKLKSLDGVRGLALLLVMFHHARNWLPPTNPVIALVGEYLGVGWMGVDLFFVLSGFLITGILLDTCKANNYFRNFYARRFLRIFPLYYVALTAILCIGPTLSLLHAPRAAQVNAWLPWSQDRWVYYCYLTNWIALWKQPWGANFASMVAHFWSLAVEEQFYFLWPLVVWVVGPRRTRKVAVALAIVAELVRLVWLSKTGVQTAIGVSTITRMDSLFFGALCASLYRDAEALRKIRKWLPWIACVGVGSYYAAITWMFLFPRQAARILYAHLPGVHSIGGAMAFISEYGGYSVLAVGFAAAVLFCAVSDGARSWLQQVLGFRGLRTIGKYSYGMYVFHVPIHSLMGIYIVEGLRFSSRLQLWGTLITLLGFYLIATFLLAGISYELFEKKMLSYKRFFEPQFSPIPALKASDACIPTRE